MKRLTAIFLSICMLLPLLASCAEETSSENETSSAVNNDTTATPESEESEHFLDKIGEYNFNDEDFTVLCRSIQDSDTFNEVAVEENTGDVVDDAIYRRNMELNDRYAVVINAYRTEGNWPSRQNFTDTMKNSISAGDGAFDLILGYQAYMNNVDIAGYLYNFRDVPLLNLEADYYYSDIIEESTLNGKLYYLTGDFTYSLWPSMLVYFFNKDMASSYQIGDLYQTVRDGSWTLDKLIELTGVVYRDTNGDGLKDAGDEFGLATDYGNIADAYYSAFDIEITVRDEEGIPAINANIEKLDNVITKLYDFYQNTSGVYTYAMTSAMTTNPLADIFTSGRALFYPERLKNAIDFRGLEIDFGILPYPKWDEAQDLYYSQAWNGYSVMVIPKDAKNLEKTAVMIEALNASSKEYVIPAFYDKALKVKFTRDEASGEMLDLIRDGISFQFGYFFGETINVGCEAWRLRDILQQGTGLASVFRGYKRVLERNLQTLVDFYNETAAE